MASFNTVAFSSAVTINPPRSRSFHFSMPNPCSTVSVPLHTDFSSLSPPLRPSRASSRLNNGAPRRRHFGSPGNGLNSSNFRISAAINLEPLKIMILGAPASGKGTQCELIKKKMIMIWMTLGVIVSMGRARGGSGFDGKNYDLDNPRCDRQHGRS